MKRIVWAWIAVLLIFNNSVAQEIKTDTLDTWFEEMRVHFESPGFAAAIVQDGELIYSKGFGTRTTGKDEPVDINTQFAIGSITKSMTVLSVALLVDEGKLDWDDRVIDYLPYFELYDPYVTESFTIRDLLTHRSGLKDVSGGTLFYHSDLDREEIVRKLRYLKPVSGFRTEAAYQNTMFLVAALVVESVIDTTWDEFVHTRIFKPLGMDRTIISEAERDASSNIITPHIKNVERKTIPVRQEKLDNLAPAGSVYSTANDMAKYMNFMLNNGIVGTDTLISPEVFNEILTPQNHFSLFGEPIHNGFTSYGFGWWLTPKEGHTIIEHSGGVDGAVANLMMVKESKIGVIALSNSSASGWITFTSTFNILGHILGDQDYLNLSTQLISNFPGRDQAALANTAQFENSQIKGTSASLPVEQYAGTFADEMYGDILVLYEDGTLRLDFTHSAIFKATLSHWHYDTFLIKWIDPRVPDGLITFTFNSDGSVSGFNIDQPDLLDVDFSELTIKKKK